VGDFLVHKERKCCERIRLVILKEKTKGLKNHKTTEKTNFNSIINEQEREKG
tara:strand:- start:87 stop:242 length:156 start_codon:yes stop_codon:yes gene_type:complete